MNRYILAGLLALLTFLPLATPTGASGILIPKDETLPPLAIKHQRVTIDIQNGVAEVAIEQVFRNHTDRELEAVYVFPLPENAAITDFAMLINGQRMSGELVEKERARQIYQSIVRRLKDPGLLEYLGGNLFRISVFPVPRRGDQHIELTYSQTLAYESGLFRLVYPLKTGDRASRTLDDFTLSVTLASDVPIGNVYSPSHAIEIIRKSDREYVLGFEEPRSLLDRDFELLYSVSRADLDMRLLTHAAADEAGFFMLMLAPAVVPPDTAPQPKDIVFVLDTSGSMRGENIEQARRALAYCVNRLNPGDRFNLIRFSTDVDPMSDRLVAADDEHRENALAYVSRTVARGGTAIHDALAAALAMDFDPKRAAIVVFLTDGMPTIGETHPDRILANVATLNPRGIRLFVFGVGDEVNTRLLDRLSVEHGGISHYVRPGEDIEVRMTAFVDKISDPVLTEPRLEVEGISLSRMIPRALPDLFGGDRILVFGRYAGTGHVAIRLLGAVNGEPREFVYEGSFPELQPEHAFIPRLWATRRIGFLLEEIRLRGENPELKDEVIRLSREYGVMTPYTSYLVLEDEKAYRQHGLRQAESRSAGEIFARGGRTIRHSGRPVAMDAAPPAESGSGMLPLFDAADTETLSGIARSRVAPLTSASPTSPASAPPTPPPPPRVLREEADRIDDYLRQDAGARAVDLSQALRAYQERATAGDELPAVRHVGRRTFYQIGQQWIDSRYRKDMPEQRIAFGSDAYFEWIEQHPELKACLQLGARIILVLDDQTVLIVE